MDINYDAPASPFLRGAGEERSDPPESCDWCGRPVSRETAVMRPVGGADGDVVPLCTQCEYGTN